jgi:DNA polymerase-3 subunit beta
VQPANELLISVDDFTESLERVSLLINEKMKNAVRCYFEHNMIKLTYVSTIGRAYDECRAEGSVQAMEIGLSNRYLLDALHSIRDEKAIIAFNAPHAPFIIRPVEDTKFFHMIAPVRLS